MTLKLHVPDMGCDHCVRTVTAAIKAEDQAADVTADLAGKTVTVAASVPVETLLKALEAAGYPTRPLAAS